jgi:hypothetical protein
MCLCYLWASWEKPTALLWTWWNYTSLFDINEFRTPRKVIYCMRHSVLKHACTMLNFMLKDQILQLMIHYHFCTLLSKHNIFKQNIFNDKPVEISSVMICLNMILGLFWNFIILHSPQMFHRFLDVFITCHHTNSHA